MKIYTPFIKTIGTTRRKFQKLMSVELFCLCYSALPLLFMAYKGAAP